MSPDAFLFDVPDRRSLLRIIDQDFELAGIAKVDERGRSVDIHCLRHTFATGLARAGVTPKVAQELLRHSDVNLTLSVYSHSSVFDAVGALESLPTLSLSGDSTEPETAQATGTDNLSIARLFAPAFAPKAGDSRKRESIPVISESKSSEKPSVSGDVKKCQKPTKKGSFSGIENEPLERPRGDLNPQPPDRQSGALTN